MRRYPDIPSPDGFGWAEITKTNQHTWQIVAVVAAGLPAYPEHETPPIKHGDLAPIRFKRGGVPTSEDRAAAAVLGRRAVEVVLSESADEIRCLVLARLGREDAKELARSGFYSPSYDEMIEFVRSRLRGSGLAAPLEDLEPESSAGRILALSNEHVASVPPAEMAQIEEMWRTFCVLWSVVRAYEDDPSFVFAPEDFAFLRRDLERA